MLRTTFFIVFFVMVTTTSSFMFVAQAEENVTIRVAVDKHLPPFSFLNDGGEADGFNIQLLREIVGQTGMDIHVIPLPWYAAQEALRNGEVDAVLGMKYTAERDQEFDFSDSFFTMSETLMVPVAEDGIHTIADLTNRVVALSIDYAAKDALQDVRRVEQHIAMNPEYTFQIFMNGRADAYLGNKWTAEYFLSKYEVGHKFKVVDTIIQPGEYSFAVRNGNTDLLEKFNEGLTLVRVNGIYDDIYYRWFGNKFANMIARLRYVIYLLVGIIAAVGTAMFIGFLRHTRMIANSDKFKEQLLNSLPVGVITLDQDGRISSMNHQIAEILPLSGKGEAGRLAYIKQRVIPNLLEKENITFPMKSQISGELELFQDETTKMIDYKVTPLTNVKQNVIGTIITLVDRTEERHMQNLLATKEKMHALGQLVAGIAHELRNPLTALKTFTDLLSVKFTNPSFREAFITHVPGEIDRLNSIVENLLDYSQTRFPRKEHVHFQQLMESLLPFCQPTLENKNVQLILNIDPACIIYADSQQVKQVMLNLILNAVDAMETTEEKTLSITAGQKGKQAVIRVTDTGMGISKEIRTKIFDPFFTNKPNGVGLGLSISYQLIKENGGEVEVQSTPGKKTTFTLYFSANKGEMAG